MSQPPFGRAPRALLASLVCLVPAGLVACGGEEDSPESVEPTALEVTITEDKRGSAVFEVPGEIDGGLTQLTVINDGEDPHLAQLIRTDEGRTGDDVLGAIMSNEPPPEWIYAAGGVGEIEPGASGSATLNLEPGEYVLADLLSPEGSQAPPGFTELTVAGGEEGELPPTEATVIAAALEGAGEGEEDAGGGPAEKYEWETTGLTAGTNNVSFISEGEGALHHIVAIPIIGDTTFEEVEEEFQAQRGEPTTVDFDRAVETAVLDGGKASVIELVLEPGRYVFACFLPDKGEDVPHVQQGLFDEIEVSEN